MAETGVRSGRWRLPPILKDRDIVLYSSSGFVSGLGDWLEYLALIVLVAYVMGGGPLPLALLTVAMTGPWLLLAPLLVMWAGRLPPRATMVACDLLRCGLVLCYPFAGNLPALLAVVAARSAVGALFAPAAQQLLGAVAPGDRLLPGTSLSATLAQTAKVAGPALGGVLIPLWGTTVAFVVDGAAFAVAAVLLLTIRRTNCPAGAPAVRGDARAALALIRHHPVLRVAVLSMAATLFLVLLFDALGPLALRALGVDPGLLGQAVAAVGLGSVLGAALLARIGPRYPALRVMGIAQCVAGLAVALIGAGAMSGLSAPGALWLPVAFGLGLASSGIIVMYPYIVLRETPPELVGRVVAAAGSITVVLQLTAPLIGASVATWLGVGPVFAVAGVALSLVGVLIIVSSRIEQPLRKEADMPDDSALRTLSEAGFPIDLLSGQQRETLGELSEEEVALLIDIKTRLETADSDVTAHQGEIVGGIFF